jgi:hypothetical protein
MNWNVKLKWNLERFGLFPPKRIVSAIKARPILVNSIPKSGTHLIESLLCKNNVYYRKLSPTYNPRIHSTKILSNQISQMNRNEVIFSHFPYSPDLLYTTKSHDVASLFLMRDPRDIVVSNAHFIPTLKKHVHHQALVNLRFDQRLDILIRGSESLEVPSIFEKYEPFVPWVEHADLVLRFETLSKNASAEEKTASMNKIMALTGIEFPQENQETDSTQNTTFRKGISGEWASILNEEQKELFATNNVIRTLGYK